MAGLVKPPRWMGIFFWWENTAGLERHVPRDVRRGKPVTLGVEDTARVL